MLEMEARPFHAREALCSTCPQPLRFSFHQVPLPPAHLMLEVRPRQHHHMMFLVCLWASVQEVVKVSSQPGNSTAALCITRSLPVSSSVMSALFT